MNSLLSLYSNSTSLLVYTTNADIYFNVNLITSKNGMAVYFLFTLPDNYSLILPNKSSFIYYHWISSSLAT